MKTVICEVTSAPMFLCSSGYIAANDGESFKSITISNFYLRTAHSKVCCLLNASFVVGVLCCLVIKQDTRPMYPSCLLLCSAVCPPPAACKGGFAVCACAARGGRPELNLNVDKAFPLTDTAERCSNVRIGARYPSHLLHKSHDSGVENCMKT